MEACTKRKTEVTKGLSQSNIKGDTKDFLFKSLFFSKLFSEYEIYVGAEIIGMVKTNEKGFCKDTIENMTNYWPVVY